MRYVGKTLSGDVTLDGNEFRGCTFRNCVIHYSGGDYRILAPAIYENVEWRFHDAAERVVRLLGALRTGSPADIERLFRSLMT